MNPKKARKRPGPSYEEGQLRDESIEQSQDKEFRRADLDRLVRKATSARQAVETS
jgi:hypothetical protein